LVELTDYPVLTPADTEEAARFLLNDVQYEKLEQNGDVDASRYFGNNLRGRINVFKQRDSLSIAIRLNSMNIKSIQELGLPLCTLEMCKLSRGLILVTGPTGSGKSVSMAALIDCINKTQSRHIITIEDPIEFIFKHDKSVINQRQIEIDTPTFATALKSVLRQDPDVIVVGEMRDLESIATSITAAETGHLVISSIHTTSAVQTVDRIIDVFPPAQQQQIRIQLSTVLQAVISQHLIPRIDKKGRVLAAEVFLNIPAAQNLIRNEKTHQLQNVILTNMKLGMQSMDKCLTDYMRAGIISDDDAMIYSADKEAMAKTVSEIYPMKRRYTGTTV
jgi:twitching motility protein PilT